MKRETLHTTRVKSLSFFQLWLLSDSTCLSDRQTKFIAVRCSPLSRKIGALRVSAIWMDGSIRRVVWIERAPSISDFTRRNGLKTNSDRWALSYLCVCPTWLCKKQNTPTTAIIHSTIHNTTTLPTIAIPCNSRCFCPTSTGELLHQICDSRSDKGTIWTVLCVFSNGTVLLQRLSIWVHVS